MDNFWGFGAKIRIYRYLCKANSFKLLEMLQLRKATTADIPLIRELAAVAFPATYRAILQPEQIDYMMEWMYSAESLKRQMTAEGHVFFLACREERPVGYVSVQREGERDFHLQKIYVLPADQGRHCGTFLFRAAVDYVRGVHPGPCTLRLNVNRQNRAQDFYLHMGMHVEAEGDFPIGNGYYMNDYVMAMEL